MNPTLAHLIAIATAIVAMVAATAGWIVHLRAGPRLDGFTAGPMVLAVPAALLVLFGAWLAVRSLLGRRMRWTTLSVLAVCLVFGYAVTAIVCGPVACFQRGPSRAMAWFIVLGLALAAGARHLVLAWLRKEARLP